MVHSADILLPDIYNAYCTRESVFRAWLGERRSYHPSEMPEHLNPLTNAEKSQVEVYEFVTKQPDKYFLYVEHDDKRPSMGSRGYATTWTGEKLGTVTFGRTWRDAFGGERVSVTVYAINGERYSGTYFMSSGNYARVRKLKRKA